MFFTKRLLFWLRIIVLGATIFLVSYLFFSVPTALLITTLSLFYGLVRGTLLGDEDLNLSKKYQVDLLFELFAIVATFSIIMGLVIIFYWDKDHRKFRLPIFHVKPRERR